MKQTQLNPDLQAFVLKMIARQYPDATKLTAPMIIMLPTGIHPYNKAAGYFDAEANTIVGYQHYGREILERGVKAHGFDSFVQHELAHWYQFNVLGYAQTSTLNVHRHKTWKEACWTATKNLWPQYKLDLIQFSPETSVRIDGKPVKVQREGSLTDVELHHWPDSLPDAIKRLAA